MSLSCKYGQSPYLLSMYDSLHNHNSTFYSKKRQLSSSHRISSPLHRHQERAEDSDQSQKISFKFQQHSSSSVGPSLSLGRDRESKVGAGITNPVRPLQERSAIKAEAEERPETETDSVPSESLLLMKKDPGTLSGSYIPKLIDSPPCLAEVEPGGWTTEDVSRFLLLNDCGAYCDSFVRNVSYQVLFCTTVLACTKLFLSFLKCREWMDPSF
jgi:hypothetical protein